MQAKLPSPIVATWPSTRTKPCAIQSSASRREHRPSSVCKGIKKGQFRGIHEKLCPDEACLYFKLNQLAHVLNTSSPFKMQAPAALTLTP
eukprot:1161860-Pelagomonas_calceolata.AAC.3